MKLTKKIKRVWNQCWKTYEENITPENLNELLPDTIYYNSLINFKKFPEPRYEITKDKRNNYRVTLKAKNNKIIFTTEGYNSLRNAQNTIKLIKKLSKTHIIIQKFN